MAHPYVVSPELDSGAAAVGRQVGIYEDEDCLTLAHLHDHGEVTTFDNPFTVPTDGSVEFDHASLTELYAQVVGMTDVEHLYSVDYGTVLASEIPADGSVTNAKVAADAGIEVTKLEYLGDNYIVKGSGGVNVKVALSAVEAPAPGNAGEVADVSTSEADGTAPRYARADHVHAIASSTIVGGITDGTLLQAKLADSDHIPSHDEKAALAGTSGSPSGTNKYVTNDDTRMTDARTPSSHTHAPGEVGLGNVQNYRQVRDTTSGITNLAGGALTGGDLPLTTSDMFVVEDASDNHVHSVTAGDVSALGAAPASDDKLFVVDITDNHLHTVTVSQLPTGGYTPPTGTGFQHITGGSPDGAAQLVHNADVDTDAAIAEAKVAFDNSSGHDHDGTDSKAVDHVNLSSKGTNTHAQIDDHIASTSNPHSVDATDVGLGNLDNYKQLRIATQWYGDDTNFPTKSYPVGADILLIEDSASSWAKKKVSVSSISGSGGDSPFVNVKDYGAVGDGTEAGGGTNDYPAIQLAVDTMVAASSWTDTTQNTSGGAFNNTTSPLYVTITSHGCSFGDFIKIETEIMAVTEVDGNEVRLRRGACGTTVAAHADSLDIYRGAHNQPQGVLYFPEGTYRLGTVEASDLPETDDYTLLLPEGLNVAGDGMGRGGTDTAEGSWIIGKVIFTRFNTIKDIKIGRSGDLGFGPWCVGHGWIYGDSVFERVEFRGGGGAASGSRKSRMYVIYAGCAGRGMSVRNITFRDCKVQCCCTTNTTDNYDNISIHNDNDSKVHDVTWERCQFGTTNNTYDSTTTAHYGSYGMNCEIFHEWGDHGEGRSHDINFLNCVFEAPMCGAVDYGSSQLAETSDTRLTDQGHLVQGCVFKGQDGSRKWSHVASSEPGMGVRWIGNQFWRTHGRWLLGIKAANCYTGNVYQGNVFDSVTDHSNEVHGATISEGTGHTAKIYLDGKNNVFVGNTILFDSTSADPLIYTYSAQSVYANNTIRDVSSLTSSALIKIDGTVGGTGDDKATGCGGIHNLFTGNIIHSPSNTSGLITYGSTNPSGKNFFSGNIFKTGAASVFTDGSSLFVKRDNLYAYNDSLDSA